MKKIVLSISAFLLSLSYSSAQDIPESQVPSVVVNNFKQSFPKAYDVEWEMKGEEFKVEFQTGLSNDHNAWFDKTGKMTRHEEDITVKELPDAIREVVKKNYAAFRISDVERITAQGTTTYKVELDSMTQEWIILFDGSGKELEKRAD